MFSQIPMNGDIFYLNFLMSISAHSLNHHLHLVLGCLFDV